MATLTITDTDEDLIKIEFPYSEPLVRLIQSVPGRKWRRDGKYWTIPRTPLALKQTVQAFGGHTILIDPDLPQLRAFQSQTHPASPQTTDPHTPPQPLPDHDRRLGLRDRRLPTRTPPTDRRGVDFVAILTRELRIRNYSPQTVKLYRNILIDLARYFSKPLDALSNDDLVHYLSVLVDNRHVSASRISQVISTLKFLYAKLLDRKDIVFRLDHPRRDRKLPHILDREDVLAILAAVSNPKHRLLLEMMYSSGMRVSEVTRIRVSDLDTNTLSLFVRGGKGHKDRVTMISEKSINLLHSLIRDKDKNDFLFEGIHPGQPISTRTAQHIFNLALQRSGIKKNASCHTFRHSFATHLIESGTALPYIKDLLGHKSIKTTEIYTHVRRPHKKSIKSPL